MAYTICRQTKEGNMFGHIKKRFALFLAAALLTACMPAQAYAAEKTTAAKETPEPVFQQKYSVFYENRANKGIYDLKIKNVKKGYILKWHITGKGKTYASFDTAKTIAKGTTVTNRLTIDSRNEPAYAAAERIRVTVNVYTAKWELVNRPTFAGRLQSKAKAITIDTSEIGDLTHLKPGVPYTFQASMTPANATSKVYWEVKDASGTDHSSEITENGVWTPAGAGTYTITASAKNTPTGQVLCKKEVKAVIGSYMDEVTQTASDGIRVTFSMPSASEYKAGDFAVRSGEATVVVKKVKYSEDGKTAYLTMATNFMDARKYSVTCGGSTKEFTASVGKPAQLSIVTSTAQAEKYTTIEYVLLDAMGMDVTNTVKNGTFTYSATATNGYMDPATNRLYMATVGNVASVTMDYTSLDGTVRLTDTKTIICVPQQAEIAAETKFTLTDQAREPLQWGTDVRTIAVGDTMYAHFLGLDEDEKVITYDSLTYASSDPDTLIISQDGKVTPIKAGTVSVVVTARQGSESVPYTYQVTINAGRYLAGIRLKSNSVSMSNVYASDYQMEIPVTATDQYGGTFALDHESGIIAEASGRRVLANYDAARNSIVVRAQGAAVGTYNYTLSVSMDGVTVSQNFTVAVAAPVATAAVSYKVEADVDTLDLSVNPNTTADQTIRIRLAEYRGGIFYNYKNFTRAEINKGNVYYGKDLVTCTTGSAIRLPGSNILTLNPISIQPSTDGSGIGTCRKAQPGVYTVSLSYTDNSYRYHTDNVNITITDGQNPPEYVLRSLTTSITAANALEMVNDCIYVPDGKILDCTATGTRLTGSMIPLRSGEQIHISTITVQSVVQIASGQRVYVTHVIPVARTLTNR